MGSTRYSRLNAFQEFFGLLQVRKELLFFLKSSGMNAAPTSIQPDRMLQVQHFVIDKILNGTARHLRAIEDAANDNRVVRRIVVSEALSRGVPAPRHERSCQ